MNYHSDTEIFSRLHEHYDESKTLFPKDRIVGIFLQGSQNYGLDTAESDLDTKLIVTPTFENIALNQKPVSTTHIRENNEHIDLKDIRLYIDTFRKQNLNFLEILFTEYFYFNSMYGKPWSKLLKHREEIAHYNFDRSLKSMCGIAAEKRHALQNPYPTKLDILEKFGYDPKQLHHLLRVKEYLERYIAGEKYKDCLVSNQPDYLKAIKSGLLPVDEAVKLADSTYEALRDLVDRSLTGAPANPEIEALFKEVQLEIMRIAMEAELCQK